MSELQSPHASFSIEPSWGQPGNTGTNPGSGAQITGPMSEQNLTIDARFFQLSGKYMF